MEKESCRRYFSNVRQSFPESKGSSPTFDYCPEYVVFKLRETRVSKTSRKVRLNPILYSEVTCTTSWASPWQFRALEQLCTVHFEVFEADFLTPGLCIIETQNRIRSAES